MASALKEVLVVGYGAVGAMYSFILSRSKLATVTVVGRSNYQTTKEHGMNIESSKYGNHLGWRPSRLCKNVAEAADKHYDYVVVATKALPDVTPISTVLAPFFDAMYAYAQPTFVLFQNGLGIEQGLYEAAAKVTQKPKIINTAVWIGTALVSENKVQHSDFDRVSLGFYRPNDFNSSTNSDEEFAILNDIGSILKDGGTEVTIVPEIQRVKFAKNIWNLTFGSIATLTGHPLPAIFTNEQTQKAVLPWIREVFQELLAVGRAMGFDESALPSSTPEEILQRTMAIHKRPDSRHKPSMLLDLENDRPLELDVVLGEVVRKAKELGVSIPRIETMYCLLVVVQGELVKCRTT